MPSLKELSSLGLSVEPDPSKLGLRGRTSGYRARVAGQAAQLVASLLSAPPFWMPAPLVHGEGRRVPCTAPVTPRCPAGQAVSAVFADALRPHSPGDASVNDSCSPSPAPSICTAAEELSCGYNHQ